jgi:hypothetical protein
MRTARRSSNECQRAIAPSVSARERALATRQERTVLGFKGGSPFASEASPAGRGGSAGAGRRRCRPVAPAPAWLAWSRHGGRQGHAGLVVPVRVLGGCAGLSPLPVPLAAPTCPSVVARVLAEGVTDAPAGVPQSHGGRGRPGSRRGRCRRAGRSRLAQGAGATIPDDAVGVKPAAVTGCGACASPQARPTAARAARARRCQRRSNTVRRANAAAHAGNRPVREEIADLAGVGSLAGT